MAYTGLCSIDLWSLRSNPAGIAGLEAPVAGLFHQRHFLSSELTDQAMVLALPVRNGTFGIGADRSGNSMYNETRTSIAYAMRFGEGFRAGVQLDHFMIALGDVYGRSGMLVAELGMQARISDPLWIGAHIYAPGEPMIGGPYKDRIPTILRAGIMYVPSDRLSMNAEVEKSIDHAECYRFGLEYHPGRTLFLRTGLSTAAMQMHFGFGLKIDRLQFDLAIATHAKLGATPMIGLNYRFR